MSIMTGEAGSRSGQLWLPGFHRAPTDTLFFAVFPDALTAHQTADIADGLRQACGLTGRPMRPRRLHVSLHPVGEYAGLPADVVDKAREAASSLVAAPFDITFDRVESFVQTHGHRPLVLRSGTSLKPLTALRRALGDALACRGLRRAARSFTPHMTLLYDSQGIDARAVEPVAWTVREFVLVHSRWGRTQHIHLGRWPLR